MMVELIGNISRLRGDDLKHTIRPGGRLKITALCFELPGSSLNIGGLKKSDTMRIALATLRA